MELQAAYDREWECAGGEGTDTAPARATRRRLYQGRAVGSEASRRMKDFHPGRPSSRRASLRLSIGKSGQSSQVTPVGAGAVSVIQAGQLFTDLAGYGGFQRLSAHPNPGLEMRNARTVAGAGFHHHTRLVTMGPHGFEDCRISLVQIEEDVAGVVLKGRGMEIDVISLAIASPQKSHGGAIGNLGSGPKTIAGKNLSGMVVNQTEQIKVAGHRRQLPLNSLQREEESAIHDRDSTIRPQSSPAKPELSTLLETGTFYFAPTTSSLVVSRQSRNVPIWGKVEMSPLSWSSGE